MINYTSGNILESNSEALVNTVNCDGYMGKGIAYQFKLKYPYNNDIYEKACKNGNFKIGDILLHEEQDKIIVNFPTKDHWRNKSKIEFIEKGLLRLVEIIEDKNIKSISIPPLGCGNGGLKWEIVKPIIENKLFHISHGRDILIYEPSENINIVSKPKLKSVPKLNTSHLLLMLLKMGLAKFNKLRLQKSAYFINVVSGQDYFKFEAHNFGPYAHSIDILSRNIKEYQDYYSLNTLEAYNHAIQTLISDNTVSKLASFQYSLNYTLKLINSIAEDSKVELYTTIIYILEINLSCAESEIIEKVHSWNQHKKDSFSENAIKDALIFLMLKGIISLNLSNEYQINAKIEF